MTYQLFIKLISEAMEKKKLSARKLAKMVDVDPSHLAKIISGKRNPITDEKILKKIAEILEIPKNKLIIFAGKIPTEYMEKAKDDFFEYIESYFNKKGIAYQLPPQPKIDDALL